MVAEVRGAAGLPVDGVHQVDVAGAALADLLDHRQDGAVDLPGEVHLRVHREPGLVVAADRQRVAGGGEHGAQAAAPVVGGGLEQLAADAAALEAGPDAVAAQHPHQLPGHRRRVADDLHAVVRRELGHPAAAAVGDQLPAGPLDPLLGTPRRAAGGLGPGPGDGAQVELEEGVGAEPFDDRDVLVAHRPDQDVIGCGRHGSPIVGRPAGPGGSRAGSRRGAA